MVVGRSSAPLTRRRGVTIIYVALLLVVLFAFCSLAVDYGHVQVAKTELRRCADAAARAAIAKISSGTSAAQNAAISVAAHNTVNAQTVVLDPADIELGTWNSSARAFTAWTGAARANADAARVTVRATAVPLYFGWVIGFNSVELRASAVAHAQSKGYGLIGLDFITLSGNSTTAYWSSSGIIDNQHGSIASNGNITLGGSSFVQGDANPGIGKTVSNPSKVTGSTDPLTSPLSFPNGSAGAYATVNDNGLIPSYAMSGSSFALGSNKSLTLPGGHYYFENFSMSGTASLAFAGPATIYCYGTLDLKGNVSTSGNVPGNFTIVMVPNGSTPPGPLTIGSTSALYANIYAPQSAVTMNGTGDIYGSVLGKSVSMIGSSAIHYDLLLNVNNGAISLVE